MSGLGLEGDVAAVVAHDAAHDVEAEAGSFADRLGGEKRLEDVVLNLGRDAGSVVDHFDAQFIVVFV